MVTATLALGIGVNTAIFSVLYGVVLRPLPYEDPERVMTLWEANPRQGIEQERVSGGNFQDWREQAESFESLGAFRRGTHVLTDDEVPRQVGSATVSPGIFTLLGVDALHGRVFTPEEETEDYQHLAVLGHGVWQRQYGGDPEILDSVIQLSNESYVVVGVMPPGFHFPPGEKDIEIWTPLVVSPVMLQVRAMRFYDVVGRLDAGASVQQAREELAAISDQIGAAYPDSNDGWTASVVPSREQLVGEVGSTLWLLWGAAGIVLLIACVNIANLLLARSGERQSEYAVRAALGAAPRCCGARWPRAWCWRAPGAPSASWLATPAWARCGGCCRARFRVSTRSPSTPPSSWRLPACRLPPGCSSVWCPRCAP